MKGAYIFSRLLLHENTELQSRKQLYLPIIKMHLCRMLVLDEVW